MPLCMYIPVPKSCTNCYNYNQKTVPQPTEQNLTNKTKQPEFSFMTISSTPKWDEGCMVSINDSSSLKQDGLPVPDENLANSRKQHICMQLLYIAGD